MPKAEALVASADIARRGNNTPGGVALKLWRAVQVGNAPSAAGYYDQRILKEVGFTTVTGALLQQRTRLEVLKPRIVSQSRTPVGVEVIVRGQNVVVGSRGETTETLSFLFRRRPVGWRVAYDTLLGDALPAYVYSLVQQRVAPGTNDPVPQAQRAARAASDRYRGLFAQDYQQ